MQSSSIQKGELMTLFFRSMDQKMNCSIKCFNTDTFNRVEQLLYKSFPEYKKTNNYFICEANKINEYKTIEENGLKNNSLILMICN